MSGIYIPGIEMPTFKQGVRTINIYADGVVTNYVEETIATAIPVPEHGDLIERDAIKFDWDEDNRTWGYDIYSAPTIIPADKEGEG